MAQNLTNVRVLINFIWFNRWRALVGLRGL